MFVGQLLEDRAQDLPLGGLTALEVVEQHAHSGMGDLHLPRFERDGQPALLIGARPELVDHLPCKLSDLGLVRLVSDQEPKGNARDGRLLGIEEEVIGRFG